MGTEGFIELSGRTMHGEPDGGGFVSLCPELDIASQGETIDAAISNLQDAVGTYLTFLYEEGELATVLEERGIAVLDHDPIGERQFTAPRGVTVQTFVATMSHNHVALAS